MIIAAQLSAAWTAARSGSVKVEASSGAAPLSRSLEFLRAINQDRLFANMNVMMLREAVSPEDGVRRSIS